MESVSDKAAGAGLKAAFRYFDGEDIPDGSLTAQAFTVFCVIRPYIDEAKRNFEKSVENGKRGAENRWRNNSPTIPPHSPPMAHDSPPMGCLREAEAEAERDNNTPLPPTGGKRVRFSVPTVDEVRVYCQERKNGVDPQEFVDFYTSKGWMIGKSPMKDWKATVRTWERRRKAEQRGGTDDDYWSE